MPVRQVWFPPLPCRLAPTETKSIPHRPFWPSQDAESLSAVDQVADRAGPAPREPPDVRGVAARPLPGAAELLPVAAAGRAHRQSGIAIEPHWRLWPREAPEAAAPHRR